MNAILLNLEEDNSIDLTDENPATLPDILIVGGTNQSLSISKQG